MTTSNSTPTTTTPAPKTTANAARPAMTLEKAREIAEKAIGGYQRMGWINEAEAAQYTTAAKAAQTIGLAFDISVRGLTKALQNMVGRAKVRITELEKLPQWAQIRTNRAAFLSVVPEVEAKIAELKLASELPVSGKVFIELRLDREVRESLQDDAKSMYWLSNFGKCVCGCGRDAEWDTARGGFHPRARACFEAEKIAEKSAPAKVWAVTDDGVVEVTSGETVAKYESDPAKVAELQKLLKSSKTWKANKRGKKSRRTTRPDDNGGRRKGRYQVEGD